MRTVCIAFGLVFSLACSSQAQQTPPPSARASQGSQDAAARIGTRTVTVAELDERWQKDDPGQKAQAEQALYDGRRAALDAIVADIVVGDAAKARNMTPEAFLQAEVAKLVKPVSDADVRTFYVQNSDRMQGRSFEEMAPVIQRYLEEQQSATARQTVIADLRKAGPALDVVMDPPRTQLAVAPDDPSVGSPTAPVTLVEFSDFQCPFCLRVMPTLKELRNQYGDKVRVVWKDFPLTQIHPQAFVAAQAGNCAREQGKFWEYHDRLFANQQALQPESLKKYAADLGLDAAKFNACLNDAKYETRVQEALGFGARLGISSTPTVYVNGRLVNGAQPIEVFRAIIDEELARNGK